jgi:hypothetical protein
MDAFTVWPCSERPQEPHCKPTTTYRPSSSSSSATASSSTTSSKPSTTAKPTTTSGTADDDRDPYDAAEHDLVEYIRKHRRRPQRPRRLDLNVAIVAVHHLLLRQRDRYPLHVTRSVGVTTRRANYRRPGQLTFRSQPQGWGSPCSAWCSSPPSPVAGRQCEVMRRQFLSILAGWVMFNAAIYRCDRLSDDRRTARRSGTWNLARLGGAQPVDAARRTASCAP